MWPWQYNLYNHKSVACCNMLLQPGLLLLPRQRLPCPTCRTHLRHVVNSNCVRLIEGSQPNPVAVAVHSPHSPLSSVPALFASAVGVASRPAALPIPARQVDGHSALAVAAAK